MEKKTIFDMGRDTVEQFKARPKIPVTVVLDNVRSLNNIGSIFRTADGFACREVVLCGISATPPSPEIHKTALGAEDSVDWRYFPTTAEAVSTLRAEGYRIACLELVRESVSLADFRVEPGVAYALVVGHEVEGVDPAIVDDADLCIEIPQYGTKHSLNVAVSTAIALWEFAKQMNKL
jgi:rRNA methylases